MSTAVTRPYLVRRRLPWQVAGIVFVLLAAGSAWSLAQSYPPLVFLGLARVTGWLAWLCLALTLCISPLAALVQGRMSASHRAGLRRVLGMTSAWLALIHASCGYLVVVDPVHGTLRWLVETPHLRAGLVALVLLVTLLLTSFASVVRALRLRGWQELHRLSYLSFVCAAQHALLSPFAPRAWLLGIVAGTFTFGLLRLIR